MDDKKYGTPVRLALATGIPTSTLAMSALAQDAGADPSARDNQGITPMPMVEAYSYAEIVEALIARAFVGKDRFLPKDKAGMSRSSETTERANPRSRE